MNIFPLRVLKPLSECSRQTSPLSEINTQKWLFRWVHWRWASRQQSTEKTSNSCRYANVAAMLSALKSVRLFSQIWFHPSFFLMQLLLIIIIWRIILEKSVLSFYTVHLVFLRGTLFGCQGKDVDDNWWERSDRCSHSTCTRLVSAVLPSTIHHCSTTENLSYDSPTFHTREEVKLKMSDS